MTKIELIGEVLKVCDEKEKLEVDNEILRKKLEEYESTKSYSKSEEGNDDSTFKTKLMFANAIIDDEIKKIHKSTTESNKLYHDGNTLENYPNYYPNYEKGMTFAEWMNNVEWDSVDSCGNIGKLLKKHFSLDEVKQLYIEAYREVFNFLKKEAEELFDGDNAE